MSKRVGIPWGPKNPLWRWRHKHLNIKTRQTRDEGTVMARRVRKRLGRVRRSRPWHRFRRTHRDKRIPIISTIGGIGSIFASRDSAHASLGSWVANTLTGQSPNLMEPTNLMNCAADTIAQYTGYDFRNGSWAIPTASLVLVGSSLASQFVGRITKNKTFSNIPIVGKYVKW